MRVLAAIAVVVVAACSSADQATVSLTNASVDPSYYCPGGASNASYDLHATVRMHNGTSKAVTIAGVNAEMTVASIKGSWLEKVGDSYHADGVKVTLASVPAGQDATLKLTIASACTSGKYGTGVSSSAEYTVTMHLATSAGTYSITSANEHEIIAD